MIGRSFRLASHFVLALLERLSVGDEALGACLKRTTPAEGIGLVGYAATIYRLPMNAITLVVMRRREGCVNRNFVKIGAAESRDLGVHIRMDAPGEQWIIAELNSGNDVRGAEGDLLCFRKKVVRVSVQHHFSDAPYRHEFFGYQLCRIEDVKAELLGLLFGENLHPEFPFWIGTCLDRFPKIAPMKVGVGAGDLDRLVPNKRMRAGHRIPMKLDELRLAFVVYKPKSVHAESLHHTVAARDCPVRHGP